MSVPNTAKKFTPKKPDNLIEGTEVNEVSNATSESSTYEDNDIADTSNEVISSEGTSNEVSIKDTGSAPPVKNVKVRTICDHRCCIGGEWYDFKKGVQKTVPDEVKLILLKAGLLMPL